MLQTMPMTPANAQTWIPDEDAPAREEIVLSHAELAECTCPDPCECDHDN